MNEAYSQRDGLVSINHQTDCKGGEGESAIPEDRKVSVSRSTGSDTALSAHDFQEDAIENAEDDWMHDDRNPRNWSFRKKWTMISIVGLGGLLQPPGMCIYAALTGLILHLRVSSSKFYGCSCIA